MKKLMNWSILLLVLFSLTACVAATNKDPIRVKCPSCGYEFDYNYEGP